MFWITHTNVHANVDIYRLKVIAQTINVFAESVIERATARVQNEYFATHVSLLFPKLLTTLVMVACSDKLYRMSHTNMPRLNLFYQLCKISFTAFHK